jgi:hypothetical protein
LRSFRRLLVGLCLIVSLFWPQQALCRSMIVESPGQARISEIDKEVMLELLSLAQFNTKFQQQANRHQPWRLFLYPLMQQAGTSLSFSNTLIDLRQRAKGLTNVDHISKGAQRSGLRLAIIGGAIGGSSSAMELAQNAWVMWRAGEMGLSPGKSLAFARHTMDKVDTLLDERHKLESLEPSQTNRQVLELEGRLLSHIRDQLLYEFRKWSAQSREIAWRENVFYAIDTAQNFTGMTGNILSLNAFHNMPYIRGTSAICQLTANTMVMLNPPFRTAVGICVRKYQKQKLLKYFPARRPEIEASVLADWKDLEQYSAHLDTSSTAQRSLEEAAFLFRRTQGMGDEISRETEHITKLRRVADQQSISGPIIGLASVARSTLITVGYYGYHGKAEINNRLAFAGRISQLSGQTYSLIATPTAQVKGFINNRRLAREHRLPGQILAERMEKLNALKERIEATRLQPIPVPGTTPGLTPGSNPGM